jgi:hypothetical protein
LKSLPGISILANQPRLPRREKGRNLVLPGGINMRGLDDAHAIHSTKYPYIVVRLMPAVYNVIPQFSEMSLEDLVTEAKAISKKHNFRVCVVLGPKKSIYIEPDGRVEESDSIPSGGLPVQIDEMIKPE